MTKASWHTISANLAGRFTGVFTFLLVPNILGHDDYAQTVYIAVLLSFLVITDFGMNFVYGRKMPQIYADGDETVIGQYNETIFWFRVGASLAGALVIAIIYYLKYDDAFNAVLLCLLYPLTVILGFYSMQYSVRSDFTGFRNISIMNAMLKLLVIPFAFAFGLAGWLIANLLASLVTIRLARVRLLGTARFQIQLIKHHWLEGVVLLGNYFFWNQLLNSGRLYAALFYPDDVVAQYGLVNTGYAILTSLVISAYLPVTIEVLKRIKTDPEKIAEYIFHHIIKTIPWIVGLIIVACEMLPQLYEYFFPHYKVDPEVLSYQFYSLLLLPLIVTLGNFFIGMEQPKKYMLISAFSFLTSYLIMEYLETQFAIANAAIAQFYGVTVYGMALFIATLWYFRHIITEKRRKIFYVMGMTWVPFSVYLAAKGLL